MRRDRGPLAALRARSAALGGAVLLARRRARADRLTVAVAGVVVLLAIVVVASAPIAVAALTDAGLQRRLADDPVAAGVEVTLRADPATLAQHREQVEDVLRASLGGYAAAPWSTAEGAARDLPITADAGVDDPADTEAGDPAGDREESPSDAPAAAARLVSASWLAGAATLIDGVWATDPQADTLPVVVHDDAATALDLEVGDRLDLDAEGERPVTFEVVGRYVADEPAAAVWWDDPALRDGTTRTSDGSSVTALVATDESLAVAEASSVTVRTRATSTAAVVDLDRRRDVTRSLERLGDTLGEELGAPVTAVESELPRLLARAAGDVTVTRSAVLLTTVQLVALAGIALALAASLLITRRSVESALVRSRGGSPGQHVAVTVVEGVALVVPAVVVAPWLAAATVAASVRLGPLAALDLSITPRVTLAAYAAAVVAGVVSLLVLTVPAVRSTRSFVAAQTGRGRSSGVILVARLGLDVVLLVLAAVAVWQLRHHGGALVRSGPDAAELDPLLVAGPTIALVAGVLVLLRMTALASRAAETVASRSRSIVPALVAWQLARRPGQVTRGVVLLGVAVAVVTLSGAYAATWRTSQAERAVAAVGADVALQPDRRPSAAIPDHRLGGALASLPEVRGRTPVVEARSPLPRGRGLVQLVAVDTRADVVSFRADQGPTEVELTDLHDPRPVPAVPLPDGAVVTAQLTAVATSDGRATPDATVALAILVRDADGLIHHLASDAVASDGGGHSVRIDLAGGDGPGNVSMPLELLAVEFDASGPPTAAAASFAEAFDPTLVERAVDLHLADLRLDGRRIDLDGTEWRAGTVGGATLTTEVGPVRPTDGGVELGVSIHGDEARTARVRVAVDGDVPAAAPLPVVATPGLLAATELRVGDVMELRTPGSAAEARIVDTIAHLPGHPTADAGVLVDLPTLSAHRYLDVEARTSPDVWWSSTTDGEGPSTAALLRASPFGGQEVTAAAELEERALVDPVGIGLLGVLAYAMAVAAVAAAVGYAAAEAAAVRDRVGDVAALRGVGLPDRALRRWSAAAAGAVIGAATLGGVVVGVVVAHLIVPAIAITSDGSAPVPTPLVIVPWSAVATTVVAAVALGGAAAAVLGRAQARVPVASILRAGGD